MKIFRKVLRYWFTIASVFSFLGGWVILAHSPKPVQPVSVQEAALLNLPPIQAYGSAINTTAPGLFSNTSRNSTGMPMLERAVPDMETMRLHAMNTEILLAAEGKADQMRTGFEQAQKFIRESERRFTRFSEESELSALNRSAGMRFQASPELFLLVALTWRFFHLTRGLFDPSILQNLQRVGYDRSFEVLRTNGPAPLFESLLASEHTSFSEMELDESSRTIQMPPGMRLDLGGIAKGWIAEQAAQILSRVATACAVDAGGDMFLVGLPDNLEQWPVALENPLQPEVVLTTLNVDPGGIATSTVTKRAWEQAGKSRHHIIDPRTGEPAVSEWISVTVTAPHAYEAEVFAKTLLIAGPREAEEIIRNSGIRITYLAVDQEMKIRSNREIMEQSYASAALV